MGKLTISYWSFNFFARNQWWHGIPTAYGTHGPRNSSDVDESHRKPSRNPWWLMMLILNHFWWYWDAFWWSLLEQKITPGHCKSVNAQIPSSASFVRNLRAYVMKGFGAQWYPHHWDWSWVFCFFAGWIPFGQGAGFLDFTLDCAFCGVSRSSWHLHKDGKSVHKEEEFWQGLESNRDVHLG